MTRLADPGRVDALAPLRETVQYNCDLSDAVHAREGALCTYLLGMRELYRWSAHAAPDQSLDRGAVGTWIAEKEAAWDRIHDSTARYRTLPLGAGIDPFEEASADAVLREVGLVYGGGIGRFGAPVFFLAQRLREERRDGVTIVFAGDEQVRGLVAPPAVSRADRIVVRTDAMRRWLWTRAEGSASRPHATALAALFESFGGATPAAIERIVAEQAELLVLHEIGELRAGHLLGPDWERMLAEAGDRRCETVLRALRDLLADCLVTLPALIERGATSHLRFWQANLEGMRCVLAPRLARLGVTALPQDARAIEAASTSERAQLERTAHELLAMWRAGGAPTVRAGTEAILRAAQKV